MLSQTPPIQIYAIKIKGRIKLVKNNGIGDKISEPIMQVGVPATANMPMKKSKRKNPPVHL